MVLSHFFRSLYDNILVKISYVQILKYLFIFNTATESLDKNNIFLNKISKN